MKAFVREDFEIRKFHGISKYVYDPLQKRKRLFHGTSGDAVYYVYSSSSAGCNRGKSIVLGSMATGELTSVIVYALQILMSLSMVTFVFVMIMIAEASTDRITEVLKEVPEMSDNEDSVKEVPNGEIVFDHVNFSYGGKGGNLSLKDINLHIKSGQTVGIIGGTGSAKSTLVQMIPVFMM